MEFHTFAGAAWESDNHRFLVFAEDAAEGVGDFADGGVGFDGGEDGRKEILRGGGAALEFGESGLSFGGTSFGSESVQTSDLGALDFGVDAQSRNGTFFFRDEIIYADDDLLFRFHGVLEIVGRLLDFSLDEASFNSAQHTAHRVYFLNVIDGAFFDFIGEMFDGVGAGDRVHCIGDAGFVGEDLLGAQGDERGVLGGKRESFVKRIGVQRLAAAENSGKRLNGHADDVVFRLLRGEGGASGLRVEAQHQRALIFCAEVVRHNLGPEAAGSAILGEFIYAEARVERGLNVSDAIGKRESDFLDGRRAGLADVIAGDGDGVPFGKMAAAPGENVGDDAHGGAHGIDIRAAGDVFLQDIVLHGAGKFLQASALLFCDGDVEA